MSKRNWIMLLALVLGLGLSNGFAADDKMETETSDDTAQPAAAMDDAKMQEMMKLSAPNENHKQLEAIVGNWNHTSKWWMAPDTKPEESSGTSVNSWVMDGRFVKQEYKGQAMGKPFEGVAYFGYDNIKGEYSSVWMDNMSTTMMTSSLQFDPATKTFTEEGSFSCPMTMEKNRWFRAVMKLVDSDHYTYEMFLKGADGKEFKNMEINYERAK